MAPGPLSTHSFPILRNCKVSSFKETVMHNNQLGLTCRKYIRKCPYCVFGIFTIDGLCQRGGAYEGYRLKGIPFQKR